MRLTPTQQNILACFVDLDDDNVVVEGYRYVGCVASCRVLARRGLLEERPDRDGHFRLTDAAVPWVVSKGIDLARSWE